jgi:hypothetical protein
MNAATLPTRTAPRILTVGCDRSCELYLEDAPIRIYSPYRTQIDDRLLHEAGFVDRVVAVNHGTLRRITSFSKPDGRL